MMTIQEPAGQVSVAKTARALRKPGPVAKVAAWAVLEVRDQKWHLAPIAGAVGVFFAGTAQPVHTIEVLAGVGVASAAGWRFLGDVKLLGRKWLSPRERGILAAWSAGAGAWTAASPLLADVPYAQYVAPGLLAAALGWPTGMWSASRGVNRTAKAERAAKALADRWNSTFANDRNELFRGSKVMADSISSPAPGASVFTVELPDGASAEAFGPVQRQYVESRMDLGGGTVTFAPVKARTRLLRVSISPERHLEGPQGVKWPGPILDPSGFIPLADAQDGSVAGIDLHDDSGVAHVWINGRTNGGKSTSLAAVLLPGLCAGYELVLYADGKSGKSLPSHLAPFMTRVARTPEQWEAAIRTAHAVMVARQLRDGLTGKDKWHAPTEAEPLVTLVLEEAPKLARILPKPLADLVTEIAEQGRASGVRLIEITQGPQVWKLVGDVRGNLTQVIAHRPGDAGEGKLAITSGNTTVQVDPMRLPGEPGWAIVVRWGDITQARVRYATPDAIRKLAKGFTPRQFEGSDLTAAGDVYERWGEPAPVAQAAAPTPDAAEPEETAEESRDSRAILVDLLRQHGPLMLGEIVNHPGWPRSRKTASNHLAAMLLDRTASQTAEGWVLTSRENS